MTANIADVLNVLIMDSVVLYLSGQAHGALESKLQVVFKYIFTLIKRDVLPSLLLL